MTKQQFLKRCETIFDMGFVKDRAVMSYLRYAADSYLRLRFVYATQPDAFEKIKSDHQGMIAIDNLNYSLDKEKLLASDDGAYKSEVVASILDHPCQKCAEDKFAWHARYGFCSHR